MSNKSPEDLIQEASELTADRRFIEALRSTVHRKVELEDRVTYLEHNRDDSGFLAKLLFPNRAGAHDMLINHLRRIELGLKQLEIRGVRRDEDKMLQHLISLDIQNIYALIQKEDSRMMRRILSFVPLVALLVGYLLGRFL